MTANKHPIAYHWIKQTLVPFLLHAFASTLSYPADLSTEIQRSINFCLHKPDHPSDGDDLVFERIFMAVMHRHKNLTPDLSVVVDNLEPLAKYLIRRAQLIGPYELLGRSDIGSSAWVEYERSRLSTLYLEPKDTDELRPPVRPPSAATKLPLAQDDLDPRLVHAQPGHFAGANLLGHLTAEEDRYYREQNRDSEQAQMRGQQQSVYNPAVPAQTSPSSYSLPGRGLDYMPILRMSPYQQQQQKPSFIQANTTPQIQPQMQALQYQPASSDMNKGSMFSWPYVPEQRSLPRPQPARLPPTQADTQMQASHYYSGQPTVVLGSTPLQPQAAVQQQTPRISASQYPSTQYQPAQYQTSQFSNSQQRPSLSTHPSPQHPQFPPLLPQTPTFQNSSLRLQPTPPPTIVSDAVPSSDFAHLRGSDWTNAAQQRARKIAAKTTAQEHNNIAQRITGPQPHIAQKPPPLPTAASMCTPTRPIPVPNTPRYQSAMEPSYNPATSTAPAYANPAAYTDAPATPPTGTHTRYDATRGLWGIAPPESGGRAALPTLEQVRSRYHQAAPAASTAGTNMHAPRVAREDVVQATGLQNIMLQQPRAVHPVWDGGRIDALPQAGYAAGMENGAPARSWVDGGMRGSGSQRTGAAGVWFQEKGDGDSKLDGV